MLAWIGKILAGPLVQDLEKRIMERIQSVSSQASQLSGLKMQLYGYADQILAEGQAMSKDKLDEWFIQKRAQLKLWAGQ